MDIERKWFDADASAAAEVAAGINGGSVGVGDDDNDESGDTDNSCYDDNSCIVSKNGLEWFPYFGCFCASHSWWRHIAETLNNSVLIYCMF